MPLGCACDSELGARCTNGTRASHAAAFARHARCIPAGFARPFPLLKPPRALLKFATPPSGMFRPHAAERRGHRTPRRHRPSAKLSPLMAPCRWHPARAEACSRCRSTNGAAAGRATGTATTAASAKLHSAEGRGLRAMSDLHNESEQHPGRRTLRGRWVPGGPGMRLAGPVKPGSRCSAAPHPLCSTPPPQVGWTSSRTSRPTCSPIWARCCPLCSASSGRAGASS